MRVIFEHIDDIDYLELILTPKEIRKLETHKWKSTGVTKEFLENPWSKFSLNVFIRQETDEKILEQEEENATRQRQKQESYFEEHQRNGGKRTSTETGSSRRPRHRKKIGSKYS